MYTHSHTGLLEAAPIPWKAEAECYFHMTLDKDHFSDFDTVLTLRKPIASDVSERT